MKESVITKKNCSITFSQKGMTVQQQNRKQDLVYLLLITTTIITAALLFLNKYFLILNIKYNLLEVMNIILVIATILYKSLPKKELIPYHFIEKITIMNSKKDHMTIVKFDTKPGYKYVFQYSYPDIAEWDNIIYPLGPYNEEIPLKFESCAFTLDKYK